MFVSFVDIDDFPAILAAGGSGNAMIDNRLISAIKDEKKFFQTEENEKALESELLGIVVNIEDFMK